VGIQGLDLAALDHFSVDMANWRYETIAAVTRILKSYRQLIPHMRREWFQHAQDGHLVHDFFEGCDDEFF